MEIELQDLKTAAVVFFNALGADVFISVLAISQRHPASLNISGFAGGVVVAIARFATTGKNE